MWTRELPRTRKPAVVHRDVLPFRDGAQVRAGAEDTRGAGADHADAELLRARKRFGVHREQSTSPA